MGRLNLFAWLGRIFLILQLLWLPQLANSAAYATSGDGKYKNEILWLTWGSDTNPLGVKGKALSNTSISKASIQVANGVNIDVQCKLLNINGSLESYAPGGFGGDTFDDAYNIGGSGGANQLVAGLMTRSTTTSFQISCTSEFVGGATRTPIALRGFAIADAEAMAPGGTREYIVGAAKGNWHAIERFGSSSDPYFVEKSDTQLGTPAIGNSGDSFVKLTTGGTADGNRSVVTFLEFPVSQPAASQVMSFQIKGGGNTAIAVGVLTPFADFGDAPASYGAAMHLIDDVNLSSDGIGQNSIETVTALNVAYMQPPRTLYLGTKGPDSEPSSKFSADALGDDNSGQSASSPAFAGEENGWPANEKISVLKAGTTHTVSIACNLGTAGSGSAIVSGWIDFNQNGAFDSPAEKASGICSGSRAQLSWNVPVDVKSGTTFVRLRIGGVGVDVDKAEGVARDGEVEDHAVTILAPALAITKSSNAISGAWTVDQAGALYRLTVSNRGSIPTGPGPAPYWKPLKVLDLMPDGVQPAWSGVLTTATGWNCSFSGQLVTCENASMHLGESGSATSQSSIELPVKITSQAATGSAITNYASVGGGMDPNNGGEPPAPGACSAANYCASTSVTVKAPAISVSKIALPADRSKVKVDDIITYTLQVSVKDSATLSPVVLTDTLGVGLEYAGIASNTGGFVEGGSASTRTFTLAAGVAPGNYSVSYRAKVLASAVSKVENKVVPSGGGNPSDPIPSVPACVTCSTEHSLESPLVTVSKSSDPVSGQMVKSGQTITYTLTTVVSRSQTVSPVVLSDVLGADLLFGVVVANDGFVLSGSGNQRVFTLPAGKLPGTYVLRYTAQVKTNASSSANLTNVVTASGGGNPSDPGPGCTQCQTEHKKSDPKVEYSKSTTAVKAQEGDLIEYQVVAKVSDAQTTSDVVLVDTLGAGLEFDSVSSSGAWQISATPGSKSITLRLPAPSLPGSYKVAYKVKVTAGASNPLTNEVTPGAGGGTPPTCLAGARCETSTPLVVSDVRYDKELVGASGPVKVGDVLTFRLNVKVKNAPTLGELELLDTLGKGLAFVAVQASPVGWTVTNSGSDIKVTIPAGLVSGAAGAEQIHSLTYTAKVTPQATGTVRNAVIGSGYDNPSCAIACVTDTPVVKPEVVFSKTSPNTSARVGDIISYVVEMDVRNAALNEAVSSIVDNLSQGLEFVAVMPGPGISYSINGKALILTLAKETIPGIYRVSYSVRVLPDAITSVNNRVEGIPSDGGLTPTCGQAPCSVTTPVVREIDAVDDPLPSVNGATGSANAGNAYVNDTLNGVPVEPGKIVGTVITPATPINGGTVPLLDVATGVVSVPPGTPAGDYSIVYKICDRLAPTVCDTATITIKVTASPIDAKDDSYTGNRGSGGDQEVGNAYSENDTLDGKPFTPERITGTVTTPAQPIGGDPRVPVLDVVTGKVTVPSGTPAGDYVIHYRICEKLNPSNCDDAVIKVTVKPDESLLRIVKTASVRTVKIGDLVRYSLQVQNIGAVKVVNANVIDTAANGFTFVNGSMSAVGLGSAVSASGVRPVQFSGVTLDVGQTGTIVYMMRVGAGVRPGNHVNTAFARNGLGDPISNQATASVELVSDPLLDDSLIFGTVFDDRDRDGWQDSARISGLKAQGGFAPSAYIANSTTVDRGQGAEPAADASAPLLHGLALGSITARQSEADPVAKHTVVIHQKLKSLDFTDDFVLSNDQGVTVRMNAAGQTLIEKTGEAAAGRNAVEIDVERKISQGADGYGVDYIIKSTGIDERGIPGVRVASVEGLLMETDPFGRYHLVGVNGGRWERGRHFILKVDPSTLPAGAEFTTSNPLLRRITPGLPVRFDFGVQLNPEFMAGAQQTAEIELGSVLFAAGSTEIRKQYLAENGVIAQVAAKLQQYQGGELLISANGESEAVAFGRADAVRKAVIEQLSAPVQAATRVSVRGDVSDSGSLVSGVTANGAVLGNVLFDTDKAIVRPEYQALLQKVAAHLNAQGSGMVSIVGHTDVRASHAYNQKLGLARAKAVYEALLPHLSQELKQKLQVQAEEGAAPAHRSNKKATRH